MLGKHANLIHIIAGLGVLLLAIVILVAIPGLREMGMDFQARAMEKAIYGRQQAVQPPQFPFPLPKYLSDAHIPEGEEVDLSPLVSSVALRLPGVLKESTFQITIGEEGGLYEFDLHWDTGREGTALEIVLRDAMGRPRERWESSSGETDLISLSGGSYKLVLSTEGPLGEGFNLIARTGRRTGDTHREHPSLPEIPTLHLNMSAAAFITWEEMRDEVFQKVIARPSFPVRDQPNLRVPASLSIEDISDSTVQVWLAGLGDPRHFDEETPSFTGRVTAGPVLFGGVSQFKLYGIETQGGFSEYIAADILRNEGIFVPRWLLVRLIFQGRDRGLYILAETPKSERFFSGIGRDDGQVWGERQVHTDRIPRDISTEEHLIPIPENSSRLVELADPVAFAKALAFVSRFSIPHTFSDGDLRFYRPAFLDAMEPVLRDMNTSGVASPIRTLLTDTSWWFGVSLRAQGSSFNPKEFPFDRLFNSTEESYRKGVTALAPLNMHPALNNFINLQPENREIFEGFLLYSSDETFEQRFTHRLQEAFRAAQALPEQGVVLQEQLEWVSSITPGIISTGFRVPKNLPTLFRKSALLSFEELQEGDTEPKRAILYNLSPFSTRLNLPTWARPVGTASSVKTDPQGLYLAPSPLFPAVLPILGADPQEEPLPEPLPREAAYRLLALERLRLQAHPSDPCPFVELEVPPERWDELQDIIKNTTVATLATGYALPTERVFLVEELPDITTPPAKAPLFWDFDQHNIPADLIEEAILLTAPGRQGLGARFDGQSTFLPTRLDISSWPALTISFWLKPEPTGDTVVILDFNDTGTSNLIIKLKPSAEDKNQGIISCLTGGTVLSSPIPFGEWSHLTLTTERETRWARFFINGVLQSALQTPKDHLGQSSRLTLGGAHGGDQLFTGVIDEVMLSPRPLTDDDATWLMDNGNFSDGPSSPQVIALPLGLSPTVKGHHLTLLLSNFSRQEVSLDLTEYIWRFSPGNDEVAYDITGIWAIGETPQRLESPQVTLGPARYGTGWFEMGRSSPLLWTGSLWGLLVGPAEKSPANAILLEVDLQATTFFTHLRTDGDNLANSAASADGTPVRIAIHESALTRLPYNKKMGFLLYPESLAASDVNNPNEMADCLVDGNPQTFWHVANPPQTSRHWVTMDFGRPVYPSELLVMPRQGFVSQMWDGENAVFQGSQDGQSWQDITTLPVDKSILPADIPVLTFPISEDNAYRHYRLFIDDPGFYSLAELRLLAWWDMTGSWLHPESCSASDINNPNMTADSMFDEHPQSFWHIETPPQTTRHWVTMDFGRPVHPTGLSMLPRRGLASQMWGGENAILQGSQDGQSWQDITTLPVAKAFLSSAEWLYFPLPADTAYRHYRLFIDDQEFFSITEMRFLTERDMKTVSIHTLAQREIVEITPPSPGNLGEVRFKEKDATITSLVEVPPDYRLVLEAGTTLRFGDSGGILAYGPISARGTQEKPVQLLPAEGPNWLGVAIVNAPEQSQFSWVRMEGATGGPMGPHRISGGLAVMGSQVQIEDTILQDFTAPDTLHLHRSTFEIERLTLIGGSGDGIDSDWSYGHISDSHFQKSVGDAIDLSGSLVTIDRVLIEGAEDKGISIGEGSVAYINEAQIVSNRIGVAVKDESMVSLVNSEISDNRYGLLRYIKKPAYTYPSISVTDTIIHGNSIDLREEEPSQWTRRYDG